MATTPKDYSTPDQRVLKNLVDYDADTGIITWKTRVGNDHGTNIFNAQRASKAAGCDHPDLSHISILIQNRRYPIHRIVWKWMTGEDHQGPIDHISGDGKDNRWLNLRVATDSQNQHNRGSQSNNKSGVKGVFYNNATKGWYGQVSLNRKNHRTLKCQTKEEARTLVRELRNKLHGSFSNHGDI